jgi:hypothetical protein
MNRAGLDRGLAGFGGRLDVGGWERRNTTNGRQAKSDAFGRAQVVGWVEVFRLSRNIPSIASDNFINDFNAKTAIGPISQGG